MYVDQNRATVGIKSTTGPAVDLICPLRKSAEAIVILQAQIHILFSSAHA